MIFFINSKVTSVKRPSTPGCASPDYNRNNLNQYTRFDIAKYTFASYAALAPLVSKFVFYLELADDCAGREAELEAWLRQVLPEEKLSLHWFRCNYIDQWKEANKEFLEIGDDLILAMGNDDHVFLDSNIDIFAEGLELIKQDPNPNAVLTVSHYPEFMRMTHINGGHQFNDNYAVYDTLNFDSFRVMKRPYFDYHLNSISDPTRMIFRTEDWLPIVGTNYPCNKIYSPTKEQFRHFDGYWHVGIDNSVVSALEIPPGFFERDMKIRYGFDDIDRGATNINPSKNLKGADPVNGVDHKITLDDLPLFWKPFVKEISAMPNIENEHLAYCRDQHFINKMSIDYSQGHYNPTNRTPTSWVKTQLIDPTKFTFS
jgi:hypothetical protein